MFNALATSSKVKSRDIVKAGHELDRGKELACKALTISVAIQHSW